MSRGNSLTKKKLSCSLGTPPLKNRKETVVISVDDIQVGEELGYPVFDECGLLLLAEGTVLTDRFRDQLKSHGIYDVLVPKSYLEQDQPDSEPIAGVDESIKQVDFELLEKYQELMQGYHQLPKVKFNPTLSSIQSILCHSKQTSVEPQH